MADPDEGARTSIRTAIVTASVTHPPVEAMTPQERAHLGITLEGDPR